ncbi:MAG: hypothetical protein PHO42_06040, partial [Candidatus Omnitrophica bacterium]|nr:hypothetical protein [Candidatus Omnitrophota bacterium]
ETLELCVIMSGEDATLFDIKGIAENLFERLGISGCEFIALSDAGIFYQGRSAKIILKSAAEIGVIGEIRSEVLNNFDIKKAVFLMELKFEELLKFVSVEKKFSAPPKFLPAKRDISLVIGKEVYAKDLIETIRSEGGDILKSAEVTDEYFGKQIPPGKKGLTFSLEYLSTIAQLTENQIEEAHGRIKNTLVTKFGASIR